MVARFREQHPSNDAFAARRADEAAAKSPKARRARVLANAKGWRKGAPRYPGADIVVDRRVALGYRERAEAAEWDDNPRAFRCERPYFIRAVGLPSLVRAENAKWGRAPLRIKPVHAEMQSRCRKCDNCLRHKRRLWTARGVDELKASTRTWFGTLTFSPNERFRIQCKAAIRSERAGHGDWGRLDAETKFNWLSSAAGEEVTSWLKRVRAVSRVPLRYLLVVEPHKDGSPHFHLLLHESNQPVRKALLEEQWRSGLSHFRLVKREDPRSVYYACKYLTKSHQTRVRASRRYGQPTLLAAVTERAERVTQLVGAAQRARLLEGSPLGSSPDVIENEMTPKGLQRSEKGVSSNVSENALRAAS